MRKLFLLLVLVGCGSVQRLGTLKGFCFEAREVGERCYETLDACQLRERTLRETDPWLVVEASCDMAFHE